MYLLHFYTSECLYMYKWVNVLSSIHCIFWYLARSELKCFALNIGGGTGGGGHQGHVPPLGKDLPFSAPPSNCLVRWPFWPYPVAGTRAVMAQRSLNMASGAPKTLGPGILAASSPNINLSTNMASEAISEHLILKIFLGEHAPRPPYCARAYAPSLVPPPTVGTFRRLCD